MKRLRRCFFVLVLTAVYPHELWAQSATSAAIAGVVKDPSGGVLPGVTVEASSPALIEKVRVVVTDEQGNYKIVDLRPGTYKVSFSLTGFSTLTRDGIELTTGFTAAVNADMRVGSLEEMITVTTATPVVDVQNLRTQNVLTREVLDSVPTGKTMNAFAALTLGATLVTAAAQDVGGDKGETQAGFGVHGGNPTDARLFQDGMQFVGPVGGGAAGNKNIQVNQAYVQEITVQTGGLSAEAETGGVQMNVVPKDGGNTLKTAFNTSYTNEDLQADNLNDELRARGLSTASSIKKVYDVGVGVGGPLWRDKLWFFTAHRVWGAQTYVPGRYFDAVLHDLFFTADLDRPAFSDVPNRDHTIRVTWQASAKQKIAVSQSWQANCRCYQGIDGAALNAASRPISPEATVMLHYTPLSFTQATWNYPRTSRLLFEAGISSLINGQDQQRAPGVLPTDIAVTDTVLGLVYGARTSGVGFVDYGTNHNDQSNGRGSMTYVTGSHALKTGFTWYRGVLENNVELNDPPIAYTFRAGVPSAVTLWASPFKSRTLASPILAFYTQDQWTVRRITLNLGLRFDYINGYAAPISVPAGRYVPARTFAEKNHVPEWKDLSPRVGAAYDLFGDGKTALKVSLGRFLTAETTNVASANNPANAIATNATRTWNDLNGNLVPDCDLALLSVNGECGAQSAPLGSTTAIRRYDGDVISGFGNRGYNWQTSVALQRELRPGLGLNVGYYRTWFGNFTTTDNAAIAPSDFDSYCVTIPTDARLPGGGGQKACGLYDLRAAKFGQVDNVIRKVAVFGEQTQVYNGVDVGVNARFGKGGILQGGTSVGNTITDGCIVVDSPQAARPGFCRTVLSWAEQAQFKAAGSYPLPGDTQIAWSLQNLPGIAVTADRTYTNAEITPSLIRNLGAGAAGTATVALIEPQTVFEDRITQFDIRVTRGLRIGGARVRGMFDIYNLFNNASILAENFTYGPNWRQPSTVLGGRLFKFGAQLDF